MVLAWDGPCWPAASAPRRVAVTRGGHGLRPPYARTDWPLAGGGQRNLLAVRIAAGTEAAGPLAVHDGCGRAIAAAVRTPYDFAAAEDGDIASVLAGTGAPGRLRLVRFIVEICASLFGLGGDPAFAAACRALVAELSPNPPPLLVRAAVGADHVLCAAGVPPGLGVRIAATVVGGAVRRAGFPPLLAAPARAGDGHTLYVLLERTAIAGGAEVVFIGDGGAAVRRVRAPAAEPPSALAWLSAAAAPLDPARRYLIECLATLPADDAEAAGLARLLVVTGNGGSIRPGDPASPVTAGFDLLLASDAGLFVAGWLHDPHALVTGIEIDAAAGGSHRLARADLQPCPRPAGPGPTAHGAAGHGPTDHGEGFAFFLRAPGQERAWPARRLALRLAGGDRVPVAGAPALLAPAAARAAVLAAVAGADSVAAEPGQRLIEDHLEPVLGALGDAIAAAAATQTPREVGSIGIQPKHPAVSVILAPGSDDAILRCQLALLAMEWPAVDAELVLVGTAAGLGPARRAALAGLVTGYGLGARLVVAGDDGCEAGLLNAAAGLARAPLLQFLGHGVVPEAPGWLGRLAGFLAGHPECLIAGARLIEADHALAHAGAEIAIVDGGAWAVVPRFPGYPRDFLPAALSGPVPVVSRQCLITRRDFFAAAGGFSPAFLSPAYADADLCFRARDAGGIVWHLSEPTLFSLAPAPGAGPAAAGGRIAGLIDRRSLARRWRDRLRDAAPDERPADQRPGAEAAAEPPRRRRRRNQEAAA